MKDISKWSVAGFVGGALFSLLSAIRYFVVWPDTDKAIVYVLLGVAIIAISWLYNTQLKIRGTIEDLEEYIQDHPRDFPNSTDKELEKEAEKIMMKNELRFDDPPLEAPIDIKDTEAEGGIDDE